MNATVSFQLNNAECNPLFKKMQELFCADGTVAEQMRKKAELYERHTQSSVTTEAHMARANFLPKATAKKAGTARLGRLFSLKSFTSACAAILILGTVAFSGLSINSLRQSKPAEIMPIADLGTYVSDSSAIASHERMVYEIVMENQASLL